MDILKQLQIASDYLAHAKVMKDRDRDTDKAYKALHAATSKLLEVAICQQEQIQQLQKVKK